MVDTCAVAAISQCDPDGAHTKEFQAATGWKSSLSESLVFELFFPLSEEPTHSGCVRDCNFYARLWPVRLVADVEQGLCAEYLHGARGETSSRMANPRIDELKSQLEAASNGCFDTGYKEFRDRVERFRLNAKKKFEDGVDAAVAASGRTPTRMTYRDFLAHADTPKATRLMISEIGRKLGLPENPLTVEELAKLIAIDVRKVPYWGGAVRTALFQNWNSRTHGSTSGDMDLRNIQLAATCEAFVTSDKQVLNRGPMIFPEVQWVHSDRLIAALTDASKRPF